MTDAQDLAHRYLALWEEYLTALLTEPTAAALLYDWTLGARPDDAASGSTAGAAAVAGASDECRPIVAELAHRLAALEDRLAAVERRRAAPCRSHRRNRRVRG